MAFDLIAAGGYGSGELGDVIDPTGNICSVACVFSPCKEGFDYTISVATTGAVGFEVGTEVLIIVGGHSEGADDDHADTECYGKWGIGTISTCEPTGYAGELSIGLDSLQGPLGEMNIDMANHDLYMVTIPHYRNLTLNAGCYLRPTTGGGSDLFPLCFKCSGTLTLNGGHIDLRNQGVRELAYAERPTLPFETNAKLDTDKYSGWENSDLMSRCPINIGDGAAFIFAKKLVIADDSSRIGNPDTQGVQFCRGASDSPNCPANVTNIGGSNIFLVAGSITNFTPKIIAKYRSLTSAEIANDNTVDTTIYRGLARCYIASNTRLTNDEGLYAYDCISDTDRLSTLGIHDFGNGSKGSTSIEGTVQNCYAQVTAIDSETRKTLTIGALVTGGVEAFALGTLVMVHFNHKNYNNTAHSGRFICAKIVGVTDSTFTLDIAVPQTLVDNFANYNCQVVSIPQYENASCSSSNELTPQYNGLTGGIFAIAVSDTLDLRMGGAINVEGKGRGGDGSSQLAYKAAGLRYIGNAQNDNRLPIGQGHGSVFILANKLIMDENTRIGATYSGAKATRASDNATTTVAFGGLGAHLSSDYPITKGGYCGAGSTGANNNILPTFGWGGGGGETTCQAYEHSQSLEGKGGYGTNGTGSSGVSATGRLQGLQGAHIMIIADTITGFNQAAISTGGSGGKGGIVDGSGVTDGYNGSAGYGGGGGRNVYRNSANGRGGSGGYNGGGGAYATYEGSELTAPTAGGSSGWAFIYCNHAVNQDTTDTVY